MIILWDENSEAEMLPPVDPIPQFPPPAGGSSPHERPSI